MNHFRQWPFVLAVLLSGEGNGLAVAAEKTEVLIYYTNETAPDENELRNYAQFIEWLESSDLEKAKGVAHGLKQDIERFPLVVDSEIMSIKSHAPRSTPRLPVLIFTNRLVRGGKCLAYDPRVSDGFLSVPVSQPMHSNEILRSNPLSQAEALQMALSVAATKFDAASHSFVLIIKSHGGPDLALTVKLSRRSSEVTREQVLQSLSAGASDLPSIAIGTTKHELLLQLKRAGEDLGMTFGLVFVESCQGTMDEPLARQLPRNVERLFTSGQRYLEYQTLSYPNLFAQLSPERPLSAILTEFLGARFLSISHSDGFLSFWRRWSWFVPLVAWGAWMSWRRLSPVRGAPC